MQFDPTQFLDQETTEKAERRAPLPVGDYTAMIGEVKTEPWANDKGQSGIRVLVPLTLQVPAAVADNLRYRKPELTLTDRVFLDITEGGAIDWGPGMNRRLRTYREALGMNTAGEPFSLRRMSGRPVKVKLTHEMYQGEPQERIDGIAKA